MTRPESHDFLAAYLRERAIQVTMEGEDRDLKLLQDALTPYGDALFQSWRRNTGSRERGQAAWYLLVGSHNQNYRSAMLDGEVVVAVAGSEAIIGLADFMLILGLSDWIDSPDELEPHFPEIGGFMKGIGQWARIIF